MTVMCCGGHNLVLRPVATIWAGAKIAPSSPRLERRRAIHEIPDDSSGGIWIGQSVPLNTSWLSSTNAPRCANVSLV